MLWKQKDITLSWVRSGPHSHMSLVTFPTATCFVYTLPQFNAIMKIIIICLKIKNHFNLSDFWKWKWFLLRPFMATLAVRIWNVLWKGSNAYTFPRNLTSKRSNAKLYLVVHTLPFKFIVESKLFGKFVEKQIVPDTFREAECETADIRTNIKHYRTFRKVTFYDLAFALRACYH